MTDTQLLAEELSELFRENVSISEVTQRQLGGSTISVTTMSYRTSSRGTSDHNSSRFHKQTAVVLDDDQLDLPEFSLQPRIKGLLGKFIKALGNFATVEFPDSPAFDENYLLHGWAADPVRILFTKATRDHFTANPGWSVRGKKSRLVIFKSDVVCDESEVDNFIRDSLEIMALLQEGEELLDQHPEIRREVRPEDISRAATQIGGIAGAMLQKQLNKISLTRKEMDAFVASAPPRDIPAGMRRQVVGDNIPLIFIGIIFFVGGIVGGTTWIILADGIFKLMAIPLLTVLPIGGFLMAFLTLRHRKRKTRTLRDGILTTGLVTDVSKTNTTINDQVRYHTKISFEHEGREQTTVANTYGSAVDLAHSLKDSQQETKLLVDPEDASHVIGLDMLILFDD